MCSPVFPNVHAVVPLEVFFFEENIKRTNLYQKASIFSRHLEFEGFHSIVDHYKVDVRFGFIPFLIY